MKKNWLILLFSLMTTMTALILAQGRGNGQGARYNPAEKYASLSPMTSLRIR